MSMNSRISCLLVLAWFTTADAVVRPCAAESYEVITASVLGEGNGTDSVMGACIRSDGTIVLAAQLSRGVALKPSTGSGNAAILFLSPDGRKLQGMVRMNGTVKDMSMDSTGNIYLAAGGGGLIKLSPDAKRKLWKKSVGDCQRVDAGKEGYCAAISSDGIFVFDPGGKQLGKRGRKDFTNDICVDEASKTVIFCGFRNANAFDGKRTFPVQICYVLGLGYDAQVKWTNYDWSTDRNSNRFLNKPTNNMADMRGMCCSIGMDGKLYVAFEAAGGNHAMRYHPRDIMRKVSLVGGDAHHSFHNSRSEHKTVFARFVPGTGDYLAGQQFCGRLSSGKANAVRPRAITADASGRVYLAGNSAYGLPLSLNPAGQGDYTGGAFVLAMSSDLRQRLFCTRLAAGKGEACGLDAAVVQRKPMVVWTGGKVTQAMYKKEAIQETVKAGAEAQVGFFGVAGARGLDRLLARMRPKSTSGRSPRPAGPSRTVIHDWHRKLVARVGERLKAGKKIKFRMRNHDVTVVSVDGRGIFQLSADNKTVPYGILTLEPVDHARLAMAMANARNPDDCAIVAFYLLLIGENASAETMLKKAGGKAEAVRALFE